MIDISKLTSCLVEHLQPGSIAWIADVPAPVLVLVSATKTDEGEDYLLLMDLGGDQPFDVWGAEQVFGRSALVLSDFRIEVDPAASSPLHSAMHASGQAFVSQEGHGIIGSAARGRTGMRDAAAFTRMGEQVKISYESRALSFDHWRILHGEREAATVIFEKGA